jgi:hypothetical protein
MHGHEEALRTVREAAKFFDTLSIDRVRDAGHIPPQFVGEKVCHCGFDREKEIAPVYFLHEKMLEFEILCPQIDGVIDIADQLHVWRCHLLYFADKREIVRGDVQVDNVVFRPLLIRTWKRILTVEGVFPVKEPGQLNLAACV